MATNSFITGTPRLFYIRACWYLWKVSNMTYKKVYSSLNPFSSVQFSSVAQSSPTLCDHMNQYARPPCPSPTPGVHSNSCSSSRWCHPAISSSVVPFFSWNQSLPASESFPKSQLFTSGVQSTGVSASGSVLPMNIQDWFHLGLTGLISLQPKGLSRVFSSTTIWKQLFGLKPCLWERSGSQLELALLLPGNMRQYLETFFDCCESGGALISQVEAKNEAKYPTMHRTAP